MLDGTQAASTRCSFNSSKAWATRARTAAVRGLVAHAFDELKLHRVEAACVPTNLASRRVLEKAGFALEGQARAYLKINGAWADHLLFGIVNDGAGRGE